MRNEVKIKKKNFLDSGIEPMIFLFINVSLQCTI